MVHSSSSSLYILVVVGGDGGRKINVIVALMPPGCLRLLYRHTLTGYGDTPEELQKQCRLLLDLYRSCYRRLLSPTSLWLIALDCSKVFFLFIACHPSIQPFTHVLREQRAENRFSGGRFYFSGRICPTNWHFSSDSAIFHPITVG